MSTKGKFALGALLGAAIGAASGILLAPKSGKETREDLKKQADKMYGDLEKTGKDAAANMEETVEKVQQQADRLKKRAERAIDGARKGFNETQKD